LNKYIKGIEYFGGKKHKLKKNKEPKSVAPINKQIQTNEPQIEYARHET
jgi:hypothetical protein